MIKDVFFIILVSFLSTLALCVGILVADEFSADKKRDIRHSKVKAALLKEGAGDELTFTYNESVLLNNALDTIIDRCIENNEDEDIRAAYEELRLKVRFAIRKERAKNWTTIREEETDSGR